MTQLNVTRAVDGVTLSAPEGATSISHQGVVFEVEDGLVIVPSDAVDDLAFHGFKPYIKPAEATKKK